MGWRKKRDRVKEAGREKTEEEEQEEEEQEEGGKRGWGRNDAIT